MKRIFVLALLIAGLSAVPAGAFERSLTGPPPPNATPLPFGTRPYHSQRTPIGHVAPRHHHHGAVNVIVPSAVVVVVQPQPVWIDAGWRWDGWQWVWVPGYWTW